MLLSMRLLLALLLGASSCVSRDAEKPEETPEQGTQQTDDTSVEEYTNGGSVCFRPHDGAVAIGIDMLNACIANDCRVALDSGCEVTLSPENQINVRSWATIGYDRISGGGACPLACGAVRLECELRAPPGEYVVVHGEERSTVSLPLSKPTLIAGNPSACDFSPQE